jgi:hypothetical protein
LTFCFFLGKIEQLGFNKRMETSQLIKAIKNQPFRYGLETAVSKSNSKIVPKGGEYVLEYIPPTVEDPEWSGDCAADTLLTLKRLSDSPLFVDSEVEHLEFSFPEAGFSGNHYRALVQEEGRKTHSFDHSLFYGNLNMSGCVGRDICASIDPRTTPLIGDINLDVGRNYKEFESESPDGNPCLVMAGMSSLLDDKNRFLLSVCVYEQDAEGKVIRRHESTYTFPKGLGLVSAEEICGRIGFERVHITEGGEGRWSEFEDGQIKDETRKAFGTILDCYLRGAEIGG